MKFIKLQARYWHFILLVWIFIIHANGIYNFGFGFLLSKSTIQNVSHCEEDNLATKLLSRFKIQNDNTPDTCWLTPSFSKAIIILIDGLRFDFAFSTNNKTSPYLNKMPIFKEVLTKSPQHSYMGPFIADPPTTTLQRLQGLTTGTLPTFIDVSTNFGGEAIQEDSIINQMSQRGKKIVFMGDDTWKNLYPNQFAKTFFYPSFNVKDLDTVDNGILSHLLPEMKNDNWDVLVAHFLGVDHCGHRYGPAHPEMSKKLNQMDKVVRKVIEYLPKNTILYIIGDHGMTQTGDHGGDSQLEVNSTLFLYSKKVLHRETENINLHGIPQVNIVPTVSLHLGLPIPFSNLGSLIPEVFKIHPSKMSENSLNPDLKDQLYQLHALNLNANQLRRYFQSYNNISPTLNSHEFEILEKLWFNCDERLKSLLRVSSQSGANPNDIRAIKELNKLYLAYLKGMLKAFSEKWAKFDLMGMTAGLYLILLGTITVIMLLIECSQRMLELHAIGNIIIACLILSVPLTAVYCHSQEIMTLDRVLKSGINVASYTSLSIVFVYLCWSIFKTRAVDEEQKTSGKLNVIFNLLCPILQACGLFSNSYIINEDAASTFLLQSLFIANVAQIIAQCTLSKRSNNKTPLLKINYKDLTLWIAIFLIGLAMLRVGDYFHKCREEKGPLCENSNILLSIATIPENWQQFRGFRLIEALALLAILGTAFVTVWKKGRQFFGDNLTALLTQYTIPFAFLCIGASWILDFASKDTVKKFLPNKQELPAQTATAAAFLVTAAVFSFPITIYYEVTLRRYKLYRFHWTILLNHGPILISSFLLALLISGDGIFQAITICLISMSIWCFIWALNSQQASINTDEDHSSLFAMATMLSAFAAHLFFATGHQAAFSAIHWNSAFVVSTGENVGKIIPALAVLYETFFCQIFTTSIIFIIIPLREVFVKKEQISLNPEQISHTKVRGILPSSNLNASIGMGRLSRYENSLLCLQLSFIFTQSLKLLAAVASAFILRRHLMVWKIFAPRLIFEAVGFLITAVVFLLFQLFNVKLMTKLDKL